MNDIKRDSYDIVIIGAGIGGLACGCYLAKAGQKVLIVEKNSFVGGYVSSFSRSGFTWDAGVHYLCGGEEGGILNIILKELEIDLEIKEIDLIDLMVVPGSKVYFWRDIDKTVKHFQELFPKDASKIREFFNFVNNTPVTELLLKTKNKTFKDILDTYFKEEKLKFVFAALLLGNKGVLAQNYHAFSGVMFYRQFIFNGGYYPKGGMGKFAKAFLDKFISFGGNAVLNREVKKIKVVGDKVAGVHLGGDDFVSCSKVVSASDMRRTFFELIDSNAIDKAYINTITDTEPSFSAVVCYLGLKSTLKDKIEPCGTLWHFSTFDLDEIYSKMDQGIISESSYLFASSSSFYDKSSVSSGKEEVVTLTSVMRSPAKEWGEQEKNKVKEALIESASNVIPRLMEAVKEKVLATPSTFSKYTYNYKGALQGWKPSTPQRDKFMRLRRIPLKGLFVVGHWLADPARSGIPLALSSSKSIAEKILKTL